MIKQYGNFNKLNSFLEKSKEIFNIGILDKYGKRGVEALASSTPKDTGETATKWSYRINRTKEAVSLSFYNSESEDGFPIAIMLQYGHGTRNGYWVEGIDYINPALRPIFTDLANEAWEEVKRS